MNTHIQIDGQGEDTIVMLHGWPDTGALWARQVADLQADYRCVRLTLPGFAADEQSRALSMDEVVAWLDESIRFVSDRPVILMAHDWGAVFAYAYVRAHPERVARLIGLDIGDTSETFTRRVINYRWLCPIVCRAVGRRRSRVGLRGFYARLLRLNLFMRA